MRAIVCATEKTECLLVAPMNGENDTRRYIVTKNQFPRISQKRLIVAGSFGIMVSNVH